MLAISSRGFAGKLLVRSKHRAQGVEDVLAGLLAGAALTQGAGHLENARDDPAILVGTIEGDREVNRCGHAETVAREAVPAELCPQICPRLHRSRPNSAELLGISRHESTANGLLEGFLSPETGVRIPVAVWLVAVAKGGLLRVRPIRG